MQPVFGISGERLLNAASALETLDGGDITSSPWVRLWLFECGLGYAAGSFSRRLASDSPSSLMPEHLLDDRLAETAGMLLRLLFKEAKSLSTSHTIKEMRGTAAFRGERFRRLVLAFISIEPAKRERLRAWLDRGDLRENWIRLAFATGATAMWMPPMASEFFIPMLRDGHIDAGRSLAPEEVRVFRSVVQSFASDQPGEEGSP